jgi:membrane fusion protein (multidrug efflux system)
MKSNTRVRIAAIVGVVVVVLGLAGIKAMQIGAMINAGKSFTPPPEAVSTAQADAAQWAGSRDAVGTLVALHAVNLSAEIGGRVKEVSFESGTPIKAGAVLVRLDTSMEQAQLDAAQADAALTKLTLKRTKVLREGGTSTPAELETAEAWAFARSSSDRSSRPGRRSPRCSRSIRSTRSSRCRSRRWPR